MTRLLHRHRCPACGELVVHAQGADGVVVLDPRIPVHVVHVRSAHEVEAWPTTEALALHGAVCAARTARRSLQGASVLAEAGVAAGGPRA